MNMHDLIGLCFEEKVYGVMVNIDGTFNPISFAFGHRLSHQVMVLVVFMEV